MIASKEMAEEARNHLHAVNAGLTNWPPLQDELAHHLIALAKFIAAAKKQLPTRLAIARDGTRRRGKARPS